MATSTFTTNFELAGVALEGFSNYIFLVPSSLSVNSDMPLTEDSTRPGFYYRDNVMDGEYKIYIDTDKSGTPVEGDLYRRSDDTPYKFWVGEKRVTDEVTLNSIHRAGDGNDHAAVALNSAARHTRNSDTILDEGGINEVTAAQLKALINEYNSPGSKIITAVAAEAITIGQLCMLGEVGGVPAFSLAAASSAALCSGLLALALNDYLEGDPGTYLVIGEYTTTGLTLGVPYYVSLTSGLFTATQPSGSTEIVRCIGYALSSTVLFFNPSSTYIEIV